MIVQHPEYLHQLELDGSSDLPRAVILLGGMRLTLREPTLTLTVGGVERRSATGGIETEGTELRSTLQLSGPAHWVSSAKGDAYRLPVTLGGVVAQLEYLFRRPGPGLTLRVVLQGDPSADLLIHNLGLKVQLEGIDGPWTVNAPGNGLARDVPLERVAEWSGLSALGGLRGSSAVLHLAGAQDCVGLWFRHELEVSDIRFRGVSGSALALEVETNFAGDLSQISSASVDLLDLDLRVPAFAAFPETFQTWLRLAGHSTSQDPPSWVASASIFEAQVGFSVFWPDHRYAPYPDLAALTNDLERVQALGFTVIQLMPRQPYPSYNVHDYRDVATSYGDPEQMRVLVDACHARGMRIILDVLLHGVLDGESIGAAADGVRAGPYSDRVSRPTSDSFSADLGQWSDYLIAWSRHILDFEPYWEAGSPAVSPLITAHPDWFFRDSNGEVAGIYTKAFDARNPEWQTYFTEAMNHLLRDLEIDGFRFDAPTYNDFPNWAPWARHRASLSPLGCVPLFERLRPALKAIDPEALMYTEPSGLLLRRSMDLNYNYDEQWLVTAVSRPQDARPWGVSSARDLARWIEDRDAFLPRGALTAHHIDSHDTFWWPSWGQKWRREQFSLEQTQLLTLIFMALPGSYMLFVGGEQGIEGVLERMGALKREMPAWAEMGVHYLNSSDVPESVFGLVRTLGSREVVVLVNLGQDPQTVTWPSRAPSHLVYLSVGGGETRVHLGAGVAHVWLPARSGVVLGAPSE